MLKELAINDGDDIVQYVAVITLADNFKDDPDTLFWLKTEPMEHGGEVNYQAAVDAVARYFKDDPETLPWLKTIASEDAYDFTRCEAVKALARHFKENRDTLPFLIQRAQTDDFWYVRGAAVEALVSNFKDEPGMFEVFYNCAVNDPFERKQDYQDNPRQVALKAIIEQYPQHPQTLPLLRDKAENDADEQVRKFAHNKLKELGGAK